MRDVDVFGGKGTVFFEYPCFLDDKNVVKWLIHYIIMYYEAKKGVTALTALTRNRVPV
jgi:hypothetical protein